MKHVDPSVTRYGGPALRGPGATRDTGTARRAAATATRTVTRYSNARVASVRQRMANSNPSNKPK